MTDATVCVPWRPADDRIAAYRRVTNYWQHFGFPIVVSDSGPGPFNLARARNRAVKRAKTDVVVIADADTIPDIAAVQQAIDTVTDDQIIYPHTTYRHIPGEYAHKSDLAAAPVDHHYVNSNGGCMVITKQRYEALGGMDEHFQSWGYEDSAFHCVAQTLSKVTRIPGMLYSFNHKVDNGRQMGSQNPGFHRYQLYRAANRQRAMMLELIKR